MEGFNMKVPIKIFHKDSNIEKVVTAIPTILKIMNYKMED